MSCISLKYGYERLMFLLVIVYRIGNIPYEFNDTDMDITAAQLELYVSSYADIPYKVNLICTLHALMCM